MGQNGYSKIAHSNEFDPEAISIGFRFEHEDGSERASAGMSLSGYAEIFRSLHASASPAKAPSCEDSMRRLFDLITAFIAAIKLTLQRFKRLITA